VRGKGELGVPGAVVSAAVPSRKAPPGCINNNLLNRSAFGSRGCSLTDRGKEALWSCPCTYQNLLERGMWVLHSHAVSMQF